MHKRFRQFSTKYGNVPDQSISKLREENESWRSFKHFEPHQISAENVTDKNQYEETPLHLATILEEVEIAKAVIEAGVDIDAKDDCDETALHFAAFLNRLEIGRVLIEAGADLNLKNCWNETAWKIAVDQNHAAFAEMLRKNMR
jgi:ankyrin repeat protein